MADHEHVEMLVHRVDRIGPGRVGGGGQHPGLATGLDDVRGMAASGPLGVVGVDGAALHGRQGLLDETGLVEGVGVDGHLDVHGLGHGQAVVDGGGGGPPVLVELEADGAGGDLLLQGLGQAGVALAQQADIDRQGLRRLEHAVDIPGPRGAGGGVGAGGGAGAAANQGGDAGHEGVLHLLGTDEVDVTVDGAGGEDLALARHHLGAGTDQDGDAGLDVRVAGLADGGDPPLLDADVGLDDTPIVQDQGVGDDQVHHLGGGTLALAHAVADDLAAAEFDLLAIEAVIPLDLDPEIGVPQAHPVPGGRTVHLGVGPPADGRHQSSPPITWPLKP